MVFARITGIVIILFSILIGMIHFNFLSDVLFGLNIVFIGIFLFIADQVFAMVKNFAHSENKFISLGVPIIFILIVSTYFISSFLPDSISVNIKLIVAVLMLAEGLYRLH
jgi:hypothetical protein